MKRRLYRWAKRFSFFLISCAGIFFAFAFFLGGVPLPFLTLTAGKDVTISYESPMLRLGPDGLVVDLQDVLLESRSRSLTVSVPQVRLVADMFSLLRARWFFHSLIITNLDIHVSTNEAEMLFVDGLLSFLSGFDSSSEAQGDFIGERGISVEIIDSVLVIENDVLGYRLRSDIDSFNFSYKDDDDVLGDGYFTAHVYAERCGDRAADQLPEGFVSFDYALVHSATELDWRIFRFFIDTVSFGSLAPCLPQEMASSLSDIAIEQIHGSIEIHFDKALTPRVLAFDVSGAFSSLHVPYFYAQQVSSSQAPAVSSFSLRAELDILARQGVLHALSLGIEGGGSVSLSGELFYEEGLYRFPLLVSVEALDFGLLPRLWPDDLGRNARDWVLTNIPSGFVDYAQLHCDMAVDVGNRQGESLSYELRRFHGAMTFRKLQVQYIASMTHARAVSGVAYFDSKAMVMHLAEGMIDELSVAGSRVALIDLDKAQESASIVLAISGSLAALLKVLNDPPLRALDVLGIEGGLDGRLSVRTFFAFPLLLDLSIDDVSVSAEGNLYRLRFSNFFDDGLLQGDGLEVMLDKEGFSLEGVFSVFDVFFQGFYESFFSDSGPYRQFYRARGMVSSQAWRVLPLASVRLDDFIAGQAFFSYEGTDTLAGDHFFTAQVDFANTQLSVPFFDWQKPSGLTATLDVQGHFSSQHVTIERLSFLAAQGDFFEGSFGLQSDGTMLRFVEGGIKDGMLGDSDVALIWSEENGLRVLSLRSDALFLSSPQWGGGETAFSELSDTKAFERFFDVFRLKVGAVSVGDDRAIGLRNLRGRFIRSSTIWESVFLSGETVAEQSGDKHIWQIGQHDGKRAFLLKSDNIGSLLSALDVYDGMQGGSLTLSGSWSDVDRTEPSFYGRFSLDDWLVADTPFFSRLSSVLSSSGLFNFLTGNTSLAFEQGRGFLAFGDDGILRLKKSLFWGDALGFSLVGTLDVDAAALDFGGTLLPSYTLNNFLGRFGIFDTVGGDEGSYFFGVPYRLAGELGGETSFSIDVGTSLAPPILRDFLELFSTSPSE